MRLKILIFPCLAFGLLFPVYTEAQIPHHDLTPFMSLSVDWTNQTITATYHPELDPCYEEWTEIVFDEECYQQCYDDNCLGLDDQADAACDYACQQSCYKEIVVNNIRTIFVRISIFTAAGSVDPLEVPASDRDRLNLFSPVLENPNKSDMTYHIDFSEATGFGLDFGDLTLTQNSCIVFTLDIVYSSGPCFGDLAFGRLQNCIYYR